MEDVSVFEFKGEDLNYIFYLCRIKLEDVAKDTIDNFKKADIICGNMLKGNIHKFKEIAEKFNDGTIPYELYLKKVKYHNNKDQYCFKSQKAVDLLKRSLVETYRV